MAAGRKTGGRQKGTPNRATADIKAAAALHGAQMLQTLANIAMSEENPPAARVSAAVALLDRGYGKPAQSLEHSGPDGAPIQSVAMDSAQFAKIAQDVAGRV